MLRPFGVLLLGATVAAGCSDAPTATPNIVCFTSVEAALVVYITDSVTAEPLAASAAGVIRDGTFQDSLRPREFSPTGKMLSRAGADERTGTYRVSIEHPGYRPWTSAAVQVTKNACHVNTVELLARLQPTL